MMHLIDAEDTNATIKILKEEKDVKCNDGDDATNHLPFSTSQNYASVLLMMGKNNEINKNALH